MKKDENTLQELEKKNQELQKKLEEFSKKAEERDMYYDKHLRTLAEFDNARKRMDKDAREFVKFANEKIINELFPILDSFDSAIAGMEDKKEKSSFLDGLKLLQKKFHKVLEDNGLSAIPTNGEKFDPLKHEAVTKVQDKKLKNGMIAEELRKGYMLNGSVLRPSMVKVVDNDEGQKMKDEGPQTT